MPSLGDCSHGLRYCFRHDSNRARIACRVLCWPKKLRLKQFWEKLIHLDDILVTQNWNKTQLTATLYTYYSCLNDVFYLAFEVIKWLSCLIRFLCQYEQHWYNVCLHTSSNINKHSKRRFMKLIKTGISRIVVSCWAVLYYIVTTQHEFRVYQWK